MHVRFAWLALAALLLAPTPTMAQNAEGTPFVLLEDDPGDVAAYAQAGPDEVPTTAPSGSFDAADLLGLSITETPSEFQFNLALSTLDGGPGDGILAGIEYTVTFRHVDNVYVLRMYSFGDEYYGAVEQMSTDPDEPFGAYVAEARVTPDAATSTLVAAVPRDAIVDSEGSAPYPGRVLDLFMVKAGYLNGGGFYTPLSGVPMPWAYVEDRMPEEGPSDVVLPITFGIAQSGDLRLTSNEPFRASNGEEGTFVFRVNATNLASSPQTAEFVALSPPMGWDVRVPGVVRLDANETAEFPVIVHTAFGHKHGTATAFTLELASQSDDVSVGRIQLGLRYPKIAQPAGHHDTVYFHNSDEGDDELRKALGLFNKALTGYDYLTYPYLNTALPEDDPDDDGTPTPGMSCESLRVQEDGDTVGTTYCWYLPLMPALEMGLDFDLGSLGAYSIPIHSLAPQPGARVQGRIVYYEPSEQVDPFYYFYEPPTVVATLLPSERAEIGVDQRVVFEGIIQPEAAGDLLVYRRGASIGLELEILTGRPDNFFLGPRTEPDLAPGGWMQLPLLEYADPVDEVFGIASHLHLMLDGESHRMANPGDTMVYEVDLHNADAKDHDFAATLVGSNHAWGRIVGGERFSVAADGSRTLMVAVTVPEDAFDDDRADLVLEVTSRDDESIRALVRLVTTADLDEEHDDDASLLGEAAKPKDTPGPSLALLALALLGLALRRR
jgi:hypothetical protein